MDHNVLKLTFSYAKTENICSFQFNRKIISMILPTNKHTQVFHTFSRYSHLRYKFIFKSPSNLFCLDLKIGEILFAFD